MAEQIKVPGVLKPGTGNYHSIAKDIIDDELNNKSQAELNALFNQGKGIDEHGNPIDIGGRSYSAGTGLKLVGSVFSLSDDAISKLNSVAVGVKAENNRGVWKAQIATIPVTLDVYTNSTATTRPVVGQHYSTLYVKIKASEIVSTYEWNIEDSNAKITIVNDEILSQKLLDVLLYGSFHSDDIFYEDGIYEVVSDTSVEFTSSMKTAFYINGAANTTGGDIPNTEYEPYMNTNLQYTTVYHKGTKWLCNADVNEAVTTEEPNFSSTKWLALQEAVTGRGISHIIVEQALSTSASSVSGSWSQTPKSVTSQKRYLWERTTIVFTDGTEYRIGAHVVGVYGDKGDDGTSVTIKGTLNDAGDLPSSGNTVGDGYVIDGDLYVWTTADTWVNVGRIKGDDGNDATQYYIHTAYADSNVYQDESHWTTGVPSRDYAYIGICINTSPTDPSGQSGFAQYTWQLACGIIYTIVLGNNIVPDGSVYVPMKFLKTIGSTQKYLTYNETVAEGITFKGADDLADNNVQWYADTSFQRLYRSSGFTYGAKYTVVAYKDNKEITRTTLGVTKKGDPGSPGADGAVGPRGAILRGPTVWKDGVVYQGGNTGDDYQDIVYVESVNKMYLCKFTHTSNNSNEPTQHNAQAAWSASQPWYETDLQEFVATKVVFAERGMIKDVDLVNATIRGTITDVCEEMASRVHLVGSVENQLASINVNTNETPDDECGQIELPSGAVLTRWSSEGGRIIQLPTYNGYSESGISFRAYPYQTAGTRLSIFTTPVPGYSNWAGVSDFPENQLADLLRCAVMVSADPKSLIGEAYVDANNKVIRPKHMWGGASIFSNDWKHGRFLYKGRTARFVMLFPGQHLDLISQVQMINDEPCLVWNINNASDFDPVSINMRVEDVPFSAFSGIEGGYRKNTSVYGESGADGSDALIANLMQYNYPEDNPVEITMSLAGVYTYNGVNETTLFPSWMVEDVL